MDFLKQGRSLMSEKMHDKMIQHSVFAAIVFLIVAHPLTFKTVDSILKVHDKNISLIIHSVVVIIIMYFGSIYIFEPLQKVLLEGFLDKEFGTIKSAFKKGVSARNNLLKKAEGELKHGYEHRKDLAKKAKGELEHAYENRKYLAKKARGELEHGYEHRNDLAKKAKGELEHAYENRKYLAKKAEEKIKHVM